MILLPRPHPLCLTLGCLFGLLAWAVAGDDPAPEPDSRCQVHLADDLVSPCCTITYTIAVDGAKVVFTERRPVKVPEHLQGDLGARYQITQAMRRSAAGHQQQIAWMVEKAERLAREYAELGFGRIAIEAADPVEWDARAEVAKR